MTWTNALRADLSVRRQRRELPPRVGPYFELLSIGRSVGYHKRTGTHSYWVARYRNRQMGYVQHRLGRADTRGKADGRDVLSYEQAIEAANAWFGRPETVADAVPAKAIGRRTTLDYVPDPDAPYTVGDALVEWLDWKRLSTTPATFYSLVSSINLHLVPLFGGLVAAETNGEHVRRFVRHILETPPKRAGRTVGPQRSIESLTFDEARKRKSIVNKLVSVMRCALEMAWENGHVESERTYKVWRHVPNVHRPRVLHLSREECRRLLEACEPDLRQLVLGALYTGCRSTELLRMCASHVGRDGYGVYIEPLKTYSPRFVFLPDEGMQFFLDLAEGKAPNEPIFQRDNARTWRDYCKHALKRAVRKAQLPDDFSFHGLRHTYASQLVQSGTPLIVVADQLGHSTIQTVANTYGHLAPQIRESEVRQRFTSLNEQLKRRTAARKRQLREWREGLYGGDWREYATVNDLRSRSNTIRG